MLIAVVGPSGVGKDSLIAAAQTDIGPDGGILFVRRSITRPANPDAEDHDAMTPDAFDAARTAGQFAVTWEAHGLSYGLPVSALHHVEAGGAAIANCSRRALSGVIEVFPAVQVVNIVADPAVIAERLKNRGREDAEAVQRRASRAINEFAGQKQSIEIDNSGSLADAADRFVDAIRKIAARDVSL